MATNLKQFQKEIGKFTPFAKGVSEEVVRKGVLGVGLRGLVFKTPVDEGTARGNWNTEFNKTNTSVNEDATGNEGLNEGYSKMKRFRLGQSVYFTNALPYIIALEFGHSKQAPNGMVRLTYQELINYFRRGTK